MISFVSFHFIFLSLIPLNLSLFLSYHSFPFTPLPISNLLYHIPFLYRFSILTSFPFFYSRLSFLPFVFAPFNSVSHTSFSFFFPFSFILLTLSSLIHLTLLSFVTFPLFFDVFIYFAILVFMSVT